MIARAVFVGYSEPDIKKARRVASSAGGTRRVGDVYRPHK